MVKKNTVESQQVSMGKTSYTGGALKDQTAVNKAAKAAFVKAGNEVVTSFDMDVDHQLIGKFLQAVAHNLTQMKMDVTLWAGSRNGSDFHNVKAVLPPAEAAKLHAFLREHGWKLGVSSLATEGTR